MYSCSFWFQYCPLSTYGFPYFGSPHCCKTWYRLYWRRKKTKFTFMFPWLFGILCAVVQFFRGSSIMIWPPFLYASIVAEFAYICLAATTYTVMFLRYKISANRVSNSDNRVSIFQTFRRSKFYVSVLIILTYVLFYIIPLLFYTFSSSEEITDGYFAVISLMLFGHTSDAIIFVFFQKSVRKLLWQWLSTCVRCCKRKSLNHSINVIAEENEWGWPSQVLTSRFFWISSLYWNNYYYAQQYHKLLNCYKIFKQVPLNHVDLCISNCNTSTGYVTVGTNFAVIKIIHISSDYLNLHISHQNSTFLYKGSEREILMSSLVRIFARL